MNWQKIVEYTMAGVITMLMGGVGTALSWGLITLTQHDRALVDKDAEMKILKHEMQLAKERDEELISMMAEEIKKLQKAVEDSCAHLAEESEKAKPVFPVKPLPQPEKPKEKPETDPNKIFEKYFPPEQRTDDYQRILRDKYRQRTEQMQQIEK